jgi:hypothetical protein
LSPFSILAAPYFLVTNITSTYWRQGVDLMSDEVLMRISDAAKAGQMTTGTLRTYDREGLLKPIRDSAGERLYTPAMVEQAIRIKAERESRIFRRKAAT